MPRVHFVKKARRPVPSHDIKVGDSYYWWATRRPGARSGVKHFSKARPRRSQTTASEFFATAYGIEEGVEDLVRDFKYEGDNSMVDVADELNSLAEEARTLGEETQEKFDNMPEGLQQGDTGQLLEQRVQGCEDVAGELENAASEIEGWEPVEGTETEEGEEPESAEEQAKDFINEQIEGFGWGWE